MSLRRAVLALGKMSKASCYFSDSVVSKQFHNICVQRWRGGAVALAAAVRWKYTQHKGVKGIRNRKHAIEAQVKSEEEQEYEWEAEVQERREEQFNFDDREYDEVARNTMHISRDASVAENVFIIQPYVKWGPKRNSQISPDDQLLEAEALVRSLPNWNVALAMKVPLESLERKALFGSGKLEELKQLVQEQHGKQSLSCIFVSIGSLSFAQKQILEEIFHLPVMDRYSVVIQILRLHATSAESRVQVAMAELPYIWAQAKDANVSSARRVGYSLTDTQREILKSRERKLKAELERVRSHRKLLRSKRKQKNYPIVAVVGYTNAGKTSLIKALTDEESLKPRDQLFATLDVTAHAGILPCNLEVIYMDTVGFMSDLPTGLMECFVATLEDAMLADVIVHVQDLVHPCQNAQRQHVEATLQTLAQNIAGYAEKIKKLPPVINVGNKVDLLLIKNGKGKQAESDLHLVSAKTQAGLQKLLLQIEQEVLNTTGRRKMTMRVRNGGQEMSWLYKNAAVCETHVDTNSAEHLLMSVVISDSAFVQFKRNFCK